MEEMYEAIERCKPLILSTIKKYGFLGDHFDLYDKAMEIAYDAYLTYDKTRSGFPNYLKNKLNYYFLDTAKKKRPISLNAINDRGEEIITTIEDTADLEADLIGKDLVRCLLTYIQDLPHTDAYLIRRKYFDNKTNAEIAKDLGKSPKTIANRHSLALNKLREMMARDNFIY
ncbi:sigma-70 family RNA polymerase sigma factor [Anaerococcus sp. AGMB09787]|uniref:sigma-70 family RNA polymerase sigma factor n=1 Tax=Anaerococcus sp. AGMB09787 TaxID=2922869 RepID=UPI001FAF373A|nr:sigma-70 family RNA polymerase sigma factor [Anaerococcus sp. AGMB09787]